MIRIIRHAPACVSLEGHACSVTVRFEEEASK